MNRSLFRKALVLGTLTLAPLGIARADDTTSGQSAEDQATQKAKAVDDAANKGYPEPRDQANETAAGAKDKAAKGTDEAQEPAKAGKKPKHKATDATDKTAEKANKTSTGDIYRSSNSDLEQDIGDSL